MLIRLMYLLSSWKKSWVPQGLLLALQVLAPLCIQLKIKTEQCILLIQWSCPLSLHKSVLISIFVWTQICSLCYTPRSCEGRQTHAAEPRQALPGDHNGGTLPKCYRSTSACKNNYRCCISTPTLMRTEKALCISVDNHCTYLSIQLHRIPVCRGVSTTVQEANSRCFSDYQTLFSTNVSSTGINPLLRADSKY